ncbi:MAG: metalloregulator ArsR/SmtB family transcription factor [Anaerolineae bacterium]|nr:metalloregulator ArsR/SmtB family transcription factor [Anaerolineae bacterium]
MDTQTLAFAKALADETRQEIMGHLCCVWLSTSDVVAKLEGKVNQPTVSHHLKKLEEANLVLARREGKYRYYTLNQAVVTFCCGQLVRRFAPDYSAQIIPTEEIT